MKERPILFSAPMVRALLNGSKTQTRRVVKPQPTYSGGAWKCADGSAHQASRPSRSLLASCPYGQPGDRLWVRETFHVTKGAQRWPDGTILYRADHGVDIGGSYIDCANWKPSIFMPRAASRITLEVTGVRVERLNDISEADAVTEGVDMQQQVTMPFSQGLEWCTVTMLPRTAREAYMHLWESINGPGSWALNPWVWVVEFKRLTADAKGE